MHDRSLEVLFTPAEFQALSQRDLSQTACLVFDVLRATSTMITALANGATEIVPVETISQALALRRQRPEVLLAGEREGVRIRSDLTGSIDFDLGNSPREFTREKVGGRAIVMSTTNGTRALRSCAGAQWIWVGSLLNLDAMVRWVRQEQPFHLLAVCSGTREEAALEDTLAAGVFCDRIWDSCGQGQVADSAWMARQLYQSLGGDLAAAMRNSRNGRRLLALPELRDDIEVCAQLSRYELLARLEPDNAVRAVTWFPTTDDSDPL